MLLRIKTGTLFLQLLFLFLLVSGIHSARLFAATTSEDAALYHAEFSVPGVSIKVPLDLKSLESAAVLQLAVSFALLLPDSFYKNACLPRKQTVYSDFRAYSLISSIVLFFHLCDRFQQWVSGLLFSGLLLSDPEWKTAAIPSATSEACTTNPVLGYQTQIEVEAHYQLQRENFGTLHSLVAYVTEMAQHLSPGQSTVRSHDWRAELEVLQQDASGITFSITLPDRDNSTNTYEVGSDSGIYWIKRFDGMNIERYWQIAWSEPEEGSTTTDLTIQLAGSMKSEESGVPIELTVPQWLSQRLLAANTAMAIAEFNRLFIGWYQSSFLASEPVFKVLSKALSIRHPEAGSDIKNAIIPAINSGYLYCPDWKGKPIYFPDNVPESHIRKAPRSGGASSGSGDRPIIRQSTKHTSSMADKKAAGTPWRKKEDRDDEKPPFPADTKLPDYMTAPKSLLRRATGSFYYNSGINGQASLAVTLQNVEDLVYTLSSAGMLQILPVEGVTSDQWPMVVSRRLARYINPSLFAGQSASSNETGMSEEYTVKMTQAMFNTILKRFYEFREFAFVIRKLQNDLEWIIASFCTEKKIERRFYGGWLARLFFLKNPLHQGSLHEGNLPVTNDIDVFLAWLFDHVDIFKKYMEEKLEGSGFEISNFKQENLLFTFPEKNNENAPYMHSAFYFKGVGGWGKFNDYLPNLDVAMVNSERVPSFTTEAEVISECVNRGLCFEARKRGTNTIRKEGKHWGRILLLNKVFPENIVFRSRLESIKLQVQNAELTKEVDSQEKQIKSLYSQFYGTKVELKKALENVEYLSGRISKTEEEKKSSLKILQKKSDEKSLKLMREINNKDNKIKSLSAKNKVMDDNESKLLEEIGEKTKKIDRLFSDNKCLSSEMLELNLSVQTLSANNEYLKGEVSNLEKNILIKDSEQVKLLAENQRLINEMFESVRHVHAGVEERAVLSSEKKFLGNEVSRLKQLLLIRGSEYGRLLTEYQRLNGEMHNMAQHMRAGAEERAVLSSRNKHLGGEVSRLGQDLSIKDLEYASLSSENKRLDDEISALEETLLAKDSELASLPPENKRLSDKVSTLEKVLIEKDSEHASLSSENERLGDKVSELEEVLAAKESEHISLSSENKQLTEAVKESKQLIQTGVEENEKQKKKISSLKKELNQRSMDTVVSGLKGRIKKMEGEQQLLRAKKKELNNKIGVLEKNIKDIGRENLILKKYNNENSQPHNVDGSLITAPGDLEKSAEEQHKKTGVNTKPDLKGRKQQIQDARDNHWYKGLIAVAAGYFGYKMRGFWGQAPVDCEKFSHRYIRHLCASLDNDDGLNRDILQVLDELSEEHRVVDYRIFSVSLKQGSMGPVNQKALSKAERKKEKLQGRRLLMVHSGHHLLGQITEEQWLQMIKGIRSAWIAGGQAGLFREIVSGIVDYCGFMPDGKWQEECSRKAVSKLLAKRSRAENFVVVRGRDIKLGNQDRVIAFLPVWDITSGQLEWHDVWPYRLDRKGYTILGSSKTDDQFVSQCTGGTRKRTRKCSLI